MKSRVEAWLKEHPMAAKVLGNSGWLVAERITGLGIGLVVGVWVARYLGPAQWGSLQYAMAFLAFFSTIAPLGLDNIATREMAVDAEQRGALVGTAAAIRLASVLFFAALAIAAAFWWHAPGDPARLLVAVLALSMVLSAGDVMEWYLHATYRSALVVKAKLPGMLAGAALRVALVLLGAPLWAFAAAESWLSVAVMSGLAYALWRLHRHGPSLGLRVEPSLGWRLLRESWPLAFSNLAITIYMKIDQIMLGSMTDKVQVGVYAAAVRLSEMWFFVPLAVSTAGFPALMEARQEGIAAYHRRLRRMTELMVLISFAVVLPISLLASPLVRLVYGPDYALAGPILRVHVWSGVFVAFGVVFGRWLTAEGRTRFYAMMTVAGAGLNILLNLVLIPRLGGMGAAWATLAAYAFIGTVMPLLLPESRFLFHQQWQAVLSMPQRGLQALRSALGTKA
jgi:PST family polysaccharide transporter